MDRISMSTIGVVTHRVQIIRHHRKRNNQKSKLSNMLLDKIKR